MGRAVLVLWLGIVAAGCSLVPPEIVCGDVAGAECQRLAGAIIASKRAEQPRKRIIRLTVYENGTYDLTWDDGTGEAVIVD